MRQEGGNKQVAAKTFQMGLPEELVLRDSLTIRPPKDMHQPIRRIEEYKRLEDNCLQGKGKALTSLQYRKDYRPKKFWQRNRKEPRAPREGSEQRTKGVNATVKEPIYKILECIKNKPYFRWQGKMGGNSTRRNQSLYCIYHREKCTLLSNAVC